MKRFFTLFTTVVFVLCAHAQVGYVIPYTPEVAYSNELNVYDYIPYEAFNEVEESPERKAYEWFRDTYSNAAGKQHFTVKDVKDGKLLSDGVPTIKALWVNVDRVDYTLSSFDALYKETNFLNALRDYVKAGGNLLLTKQATRLAFEIGRINYTPEWSNGGYSTGVDTWSINPHLGYSVNHTDRSGHAIFHELETINTYAYTTYPLVGADNRTNNNNNYEPMKRENGSKQENSELDKLSNFESDWNCHVLATWGHVTDFCVPGIIEFFPKGDFKGTIMVNGFSAYQWGSSNSKIDNVKKLTKNCLDYLSQRVTASWTTSPKANPIIKEEEDVAITMSEHSILSFTSSDVTKAEINDVGHISYNHFGNVTITAVVTGDGVNIPKNKVELSAICTVTGGTPAQYAYALPFSFYTMNNYEGGDATWKPDYQAAKWFYDNYVAAGKGCFINPTNYSSSTPIPTTIKVLWVNNDRVGQESDALKTAFGGDNFTDALSAFVVAGGNVFLSKQATRFIGDIGRAKWWPSYGVSREQKDDETWYMVDNFVAVNKGEGARKVNFHDHPVYATLRATKSNQYTEHIWTDDKSVVHNEGKCKWPLFAGEGNTTKMTYIWGEPTDEWSRSYGMSSDNRSTEYLTLTNFETNAGMKCKILGGWGHTTALDAVGFVEFPPATIDAKEFKGSVICIGLPAYQWSVGNTCIGNVRALTQGILQYLNTVFVTEPNTEIPSTVDYLVVYQGGSVSNPGNITIRDSITYIRPAVGGTAGNELGQWYTFCLPFTPSHCYVYEEGDKDYEINSVYLSRAAGETESNPLGPGSFYLQTFASPDGWAYIGGGGKPLEDTPYIIKFLDGSENSGLADYFTSNPTVKFVGGPQTIDGTDDGTGGAPNGDYTYHVNHTLRKLTMRHVYQLNTATNMFEYDYGGPSEIMPFECYIKASTPELAAAYPKLALRPRGSKEQTEIATAMDNIADSTAQTQKILRNGQVVIVRDNKMYNVFGQEL